MPHSRLNLFIAVASMFAFVTCQFGVNKDFRLADGETFAGGFNTVNGDVIVGKDCRVGGACRTVNGRIRVGRNSEVRDLQTVNGSISVSAKAIVRGDIDVVNGDIDCAREVEVQGNIGTVNGDIDLEETVVERDIETINGDISLADECEVKGDIVVRRNRGNRRRHDRLRIRIAGDSIVRGDVIVEDNDRDVVVILIDGGEVKGEIRNAEVIRR